MPRPVAELIGMAKYVFRFWLFVVSKPPGVNEPKLGRPVPVCAWRKGGNRKRPSARAIPFMSVGLLGYHEVGVCKSRIKVDGLDRRRCPERPINEFLNRKGILNAGNTSIVGIGDRDGDFGRRTTTAALGYR